MVKSKIIPVGLYEANCIILWNESNKALIIDPGADADLITEYIEKAKLEPVAVFLTHGHFDHVSGVDGILEKYTLPVYLHGGDKELLFCDLNISQPGYPRIMREDAINYSLDEGDEIPLFGGKILHTPGHSKGSTCLYFESDKLLISGDTLFSGSIGRTDLPGGSYMQIMKSLKRLTELPDETMVISGHGPITNIRSEKLDNPYLQ
jgi:glyoxylase-like metal-dependent hydrolase (beta-lactamase superfamily II)